MMNDITPLRFFMGANTPQGFFGFLNDLYDAETGWRAFLIKGGPGTGKSSLMRRVWQTAAAHGEEAQAILCSSDPDSLDGVIIPSHKVCIIDATAPHVIEPQYWGAVEQLVDLSACMDARALHRQAPHVIEATRACSALHARVRNFLGAAASLLNESRRMAEKCTDIDKIGRQASRIATREWERRPHDQGGREWRRFLSAVTPQGIVTLHGTLQAYCPRLYALEDDYGAAAQLLLRELRQRALEDGQSIISCYCPLAPTEKLEHLLLPEQGVGFTTSNVWHKADFPVYRRIHAARFTDMEALRQHKQRLSFNRRAARELLNEAVGLAGEAKRAHDEMETYTAACMDWEQVSAVTERVLGEMTDIFEER